MSNVDTLKQAHNNWVTSMGAWFAGDKVIYRGKDLHRDLKDLQWMGLLLYGITGRVFDDTQLRVFNAMWAFTSFPEPRLWNNRIASLAGTVRSTSTQAMSSAIAASEASIYGHRPNTRAIDYFLRTRIKLEAGELLIDCIKSEFKQYRTIFGYGRPLNRQDERNPHFLALLEETGLDDGPHIKLALETEQVLLQGRWRMQVNITGLAAAFAADMGLTPRQHHIFLTTVFLAGMPP